ncbi:tryptophan transporter [Clostridium cellulovorans]|uniref:Tryptophan transport protein n=1 Tax=Clostridium cellulovorans (strain ATCC 35296 / DSM 3052 / OCM 3 / 743B) TaxID=573061 RepID=D9SVP8_CLOC7|nr:tryptophan transporter [Clostridium cellulovorans]ADL53109.1 hypothetical protein Clocel_3431 [Clostridium cellulovorans 743B]
MSTRKLTIASLFLAVGLILHYIMPGFLGGMKPDPFLAMMFITILICGDYKTTLAVGLASGILTALTTTMPGGQIPNIIDKIITAQVVFFILKTFNTLEEKAKGNSLIKQVKMVVVSIVGTLVSGTIFLSTAIYIMGVELPFGILFNSVVLPATVGNTVLVLFTTNVVLVALKRSSFKI